MYDYIIVGAGSAGGVLAHRLSENPENKVCLIEAGDSSESAMVNIPGAFGSHMFWHKYNWAFNSQPDASTDHKGHFCPRGKGLGGSSSINGMVYTRGHSSDYDHWAAQGCTGWDYESILPYFKKSEDNDQGESIHHGIGGLLPVTTVSKANYPVEDVFLEATKQAGYPANVDFNDNQLEGFGRYQFTTKDGHRAGVAKCFIRPVLSRPNLTLISQAHATKIVLDGKKAVGVTYQKGGKQETVNASKEVILSGGAFNSPQLLMLSGIGDVDELTAVGIEVKHELNGVGKNLQEHPDIPVVYDSLKKDAMCLSALLPRTKEAVQYLAGKHGPLKNSITVCGGYFKANENESVPDIQTHFVPLKFADHGRNIEYLMSHGFSAHINVARPKSRGFVALRNADPLADPIIHLNLLSKQEDLDVLVNGIKKMRKIINQPAFAPYRGTEVFPGSRVQTDEDLAKAIRANVAHVYHPVGTCKMGNDDEAVVDHELKVHGLESLRVVDASVMPTLISSNTNAPTIMIAEKAADMILAEHGRKDEADA